MRDDPPNEGPKGGLPARLLKYVEEFFTDRFLKGLSADDREELRENLEVVRRTLVDRRPPRLAVAGSDESELRDLLGAIAGDALPEEIDVKAYLGRGRWYDYEIRDVLLEILDLRRRDGEPPNLKALERRAPDIVVLAWNYDARTDDENREDPGIEDLERIVERSSTPGTSPPKVVALVDADRLPEDVTPYQAERTLRTKLRDAALRDTDIRVVQRRDIRELDRDLVEMTPLEARMQLARAVQTRQSKRRLARSIIQSSAGMTAALATIPLPFADIVPITGVQIAMIAAIGHLSGRRLSLKTVGEFAAAIGLNVGAGYALREIVRALIQFIPFAGSVVSSGIAAGATYALGNAAVHYFIGESDEFDAAPERVQRPAWEEATRVEQPEESTE